jgi:F-type H+-transporting ATPase subunit a
MHELPRQVLIRLPEVFGVDLSITNEVVLLWAAALVTLAVLAPACRRRGVVPKGWYQNLLESLVEFVENQVVKESIGTEGLMWAPFLLTLFFFILFANLLGLVPLPHHVKAATANINVTLGLALIVFIVTLSINIRRHGLLGFLKKFMPSGVPRAVAVLVIPIEVISWLAKPLSLALRLFANMAAGHALILTFVGIAATAAFYLKPLPVAGAVIMSAFEIFVCLIQAFIFTMLSGVYIKEAIEAH